MKKKKKIEMKNAIDKEKDLNQYILHF